MSRRYVGVWQSTVDGTARYGKVFCRFWFSGRILIKSSKERSSKVDVKSSQVTSRQTFPLIPPQAHAPVKRDPLQNWEVGIAPGLYLSKRISDSQLHHALSQFLSVQRTIVKCCKSFFGSGGAFRSSIQAERPVTFFLLA